MNEEIDEFQGHGGAYVVDDPKNNPGKRRQVEKPTQDHPEGNCARDWDHVPLIGGVRKDDLDHAIDAFHKKHGRAANKPNEITEVHHEAKRIGRERAKERAAKRDAAIAEQAAAAKSSAAEPSEQPKEKGGKAK
jgi:hypothetical protein